MSETLKDIKNARTCITNCITAYSVFQDEEINAEQCVDALMDEIQKASGYLARADKRLENFVKRI